MTPETGPTLEQVFEQSIEPHEIKPESPPPIPLSAKAKKCCVWISALSFIGACLTGGGGGLLGVIFLITGGAPPPEVWVVTAVLTMPLLLMTGIGLSGVLLCSRKPSASSEVSEETSLLTTNPFANLTLRLQKKEEIKNRISSNYGEKNVTDNFSFLPPPPLDNRETGNTTETSLEIKIGRNFT